MKIKYEKDKTVSKTQLQIQFVDLREKLVLTGSIAAVSQFIEHKNVC